MMTAAAGDERIWVFRLILAAVAGAAIGLERELHAHPAGMRTHMLVSVGAAAFTVLSMHGFEDVVGNDGVTLDPSRVSAQIVSGIGFIGGGAILKYGVSIRGLTTAGSLWATAAVGFAFGSGLLLFGTAATAIILLSLWPLNIILDRLRADRQGDLRVRLGMTRLETLGAVYDYLTSDHVAIASIASHRAGKNRYEVDLRVHLPPQIRLPDIELRLAALDDVEVLEAAEQAY